MQNVVGAKFLPQSLRGRRSSFATRFDRGCFFPPVVVDPLTVSTLTFRGAHESRTANSESPEELDGAIQLRNSTELFWPAKNSLFAGMFEIFGSRATPQPASAGGVRRPSQDDERTSSGQAEPDVALHWLWRVVGRERHPPSARIDFQRSALALLQSVRDRIDFYWRDSGPMTHAALVFQPVSWRHLRSAIAIDIRVPRTGGWATSIHLLTEGWNPPPDGVCTSELDWTAIQVIAALSRYNAEFGIYDKFYNNCRSWASGLPPFMARYGRELATLPEYQGVGHDEAALAKVAQAHRHALRFSDAPFVKTMLRGSIDVTVNGREAAPAAA